MPKYFSFLLCLSISIGAFAQKKNSLLKKEVAITQICAKLNQQLISGDSEKLESLLDEKLSFGHSNGLIETKSDLINHLQTGYLKYQQIEDQEISEIQILKQLATVRRLIKVRGNLQDRSFDMKLKVLETWIRKGKSWQLLNRQSIRSE